MERRLQKLLVFGIFFLDVTVSFRHSGQYVLYRGKRKTWTQAQRFCRRLYSDLGTVSGDTDVDRIAAMTKDWHRAFWIGLHDDVSGWKWSYGDHAGSGFRRWQEGQPDNAGADQHCVSMTEDGRWRDNSCTLVKAPLICFSDGGDTEPAYVLVTDEMNWVEAQSYCRRHHTDLVSVRSGAENDRLKERLLDDPRAQEAWIGLHRDSWRWSDEGRNSTFRHWREHQPDNMAGDEACVQIQNQRWVDSSCRTKSAFLCQRETSANPTADVTNDDEDRKIMAIRMTVRSDADLHDRTVTAALLKQLETDLIRRGVADFSLRWRENNGVVFQCQK